MNVKKILSILLLFATLFSSAACTENTEADESKDTVQSTVQSSEEETSEPASEESSTVTVPVGYSDGKTADFHIVANSMFGDVMLKAGLANDADKDSPYYVERLTWLLTKYLDETSYTAKALKDYLIFSTAETEVPISFEDVYMSKFCMTTAPRLEDIPMYTYDEVKAMGVPMFLSAQTIPLTENVISDIMAEHSVDEKQAVAIYRQKVIDLFTEYGLHVDGFGDIYTFDTYRAWTMANKVDPWDEWKEKEEFVYEDEVYETCTHLIFYAYGKGLISPFLR